MWTYLFAHNSVRHTEVIKFLNESEIVEHWAGCLPFSFLVVTQHTARDFAQVVREAFPQKGFRFVVLDTDTDRGGWLNKGQWDLMKRPEAYSRENRVHTLSQRLVEASKRKP